MDIDPESPHARAMLDAEPFRVGFLLVDGFALLSYAAAVEPLRAANVLAGRVLFEITELPAEGAQSTSSGGAVVRATAHIGERVDFDLVIVVAGGDPTRFASLRVERWLRHLAQRDIALGGISGGPLVLARAGLMGNRRMTLHWEHRSLLQDLSPPPRVERSLFVIEPDRMTCAGGTAGLDMMYALIASRHGNALAREVSEWLVHTGVRAGDEAQRGALAQRHDTHHPALLAALDAMETHVADPLSLEQVAALAGVGARQLNRLFRERFGHGAITHYRGHRLERARALLARSSLPVAEIARITGFANATHFTRRFREAFGVTPAKGRAVETASGTRPG